jgi:4a-hydroxytetrahydrobiopterin dehydratase
LSLNGKWITKEFQFKNFIEAMKFVNRAAGLAEGEGHHPDIHIRYNRVRFDTWTHAVGGLSENNFILAAKIDTLK